MVFPKIRMRRLRSSEAIRKLVRETTLSVDNLVYPLFVRDGEGIKEPIKSMTGCFHFSPDTVAAEAAEVADLGIPAVLLFGLPNKKDDIGSQAWAENGVVQQAVREIKNAVPQLLVITDICLCGYTKHGHCGVIKFTRRSESEGGDGNVVSLSNGKIDNDETCKLLAKIALSHAQAGADIVAPSDMMDGRVKYIREALEENGFQDVAIMSYAAKFASAFYGPFRDAAESAPSEEFVRLAEGGRDLAERRAGTSLCDRKTYQMDAANVRQAMAEIALDIEEGADIIMIKPASLYLDVIYRARQRFDCPIAAYNVSGEYMMVNCAAAQKLIDKEDAMLEMLTAIKRAGADIIITYFAKEVARQLKRKK